MNPYVFFVGCPRSGTTLLARIGDRHPKLAIIRELHWLPRWWERREGLTEDGLVTPNLAKRLREHHRFERLDVEPAAIDPLVANGVPRHYARFVSDLFDLHGQTHGKRLVGEKTPHYARSLPTLHSLWPGAKIVHIIRDGRDVALSLLDWSRGDRAAGRFPTWDEDPVTTAALFWEWHVRLGREAISLLGECYYELRYELLVADPKRECANLCDFLGLTYDPVMLRFHEGQMRSKKSGPRRPVTPGLRSWREQMAPEEVAQFEASAGPLLAELGYKRATAFASRKRLAQAESFRSRFADHARSQGEAVPEAWRV